MRSNLAGGTYPVNVPLRTEAQFSAWFRKHLVDFGFTKALTDWKGRAALPYPDFYCLRDDGGVVKVELELLAYNFILHGHDPQGCDLVVAAEDNLAYYGTSELGVPLKTVGFPVDVKAHVRSKAVARKMVARSRREELRAVAPLLIWWQPPGARRCFSCREDLGEGRLDTVGRVIWPRVARDHNRGCIDAAVEQVLRELP